MSLQKPPAFAFAAWLLSACSTIGPIEMSGDPAALAAFSSFHIAEEQFSFATEISAEQRERISKELRAAAVSALEKRGYHEAADADVLVGLGAISRPTLSTEAESDKGGALHHVDTSVLNPGETFNTPQFEGPPSGVGREGDLTLFLLDPKTRRVLWRASATGAATTPSEALRMARTSYAEMVAKLPKAGVRE